MAFVIPPEKEPHSKLPHFDLHFFDSNSHVHQLHQAALHMLESNNHSHAPKLHHPALQVLVDHAKRARSFHPLPDHILDGTEHDHTIPTPIVFAVEPLIPEDPWLLIHPADINLFQVYEDRRLRPDQSTRHNEVYHMNAYTIINSTPRIILPVNLIALDNLRGTIVSLDRFYHVEAKNGPPHLHHIVTDRVGRTHDLCSARYVERDAYHVNRYDANKESRGKIVATEGVVPFPEEVEFYSFYFRKDGTRLIYSNPPEIRICSVPRTQKSLKGKGTEIGTQRHEDLSSQDPDAHRNPLRRKPSVLAKIGGTIKTKVRSMTAPVPMRSIKKGLDSPGPEGPFNLTYPPQAMSTNSITPPPQFTPTQSRRATATRLVSSPFRQDLDISAQKAGMSAATPPLQHNLDQSARKFDTSSVTAQHSLSESPKAIAATDEQAEVDGNDSNPYLTLITATESFSLLPSPVSASTPRSPKEFKPGEENLPLAFCGDRSRDEESD